MPNHIDINNTANVIALLKKLKPETLALWGKMTPQHMVEHICFFIQISTGNKPQKQYTTPEEAERIKSEIIYSTAQLPKGIKSAILPPEPPPYIYSDLKTSILEAEKWLSSFHEYYRMNPDALHMQPRMGLLNYTEWTILHNKHFTHHFKQFGLIPL